MATTSFGIGFASSQVLFLFGTTLDVSVPFLRILYEYFSVLSLSFSMGVGGVTVGISVASNCFVGFPHLSLMYHHLLPEFHCWQTDGHSAVHFRLLVLPQPHPPLRYVVPK